MASRGLSQPQETISFILEVRDLGRTSRGSPGRARSPSTVGRQVPWHKGLPPPPSPLCFPPNHPTLKPDPDLIPAGPLLGHEPFLCRLVFSSTTLQNDLRDLNRNGVLDTALQSGQDSLNSLPPFHHFPGNSPSAPSAPGRKEKERSKPGGFLAPAPSQKDAPIMGANTEPGRGSSPNP